MGIPDSILQTEHTATLLTSRPNSKRLEVSKNVMYIAVTSRASKLQVFKVQPGRDLNLGHKLESLNTGKLTHAGGQGSNPSLGEL